ncbi:MAG: DUF1707 and DUF4870 domain-containing protein [Propionibacteriaceae bacterium]
MNATFEHPSLKLPVTEEQRDRAEKWLQQAYAEDRLSEDDFDRRIGQVISAGSRRDLNAAFFGLVHVPVPSQALGVHPAYRPMPHRTESANRGTAAIAHFSALGTSFVGPGILYAVAGKGSYGRKEAAKAFNFQVISIVALIIGVIASSLLPNGIDNILFPLISIGWLLFTIVGGAKAAQGEDWTNPVRKVVKLEILKEK